MQDVDAPYLWQVGLSYIGDVQLWNSNSENIELSESENLPYFWSSLKHRA